MGRRGRLCRYFTESGYIDGFSVHAELSSFEFPQGLSHCRLDTVNVNLDMFNYGICVLLTFA